MEYLLVGKIVSTHGIKGEIRILSDFQYKERVFIPNMKMYIGKEKKEVVITSFRHHKTFEMITIEGYTNINEVLKYIREPIYIKKNDLVLEKSEYLENDLIGINIYQNNEKCGIIIGITDSGNKNKTLICEINGKKVLVPYHKDFIKSIDLSSKKIEFSLIEGMY